MARPPAMPPEDKAEIVLAVLSGELSVAQAARRAGVSEQAIGNWRRQFVTSGSLGLEGQNRQASEREQRLLAQIAELKAALGEIYIQLRAKRQGASHHMIPSQTSRPYGVTAGSISRGPAASSGSPAALRRNGR